MRLDTLAEQAGVISRVQAQANGLSEGDVRRLLRRREWVKVHPGVYVNHTGELTWLQRAWAAVLFAWPAAGACSVLEHGYLIRVERAHGLPRAERQRRATATLGVVYRDVEYDTFIVELDGRLFHDSAAQRDRDIDRDLDAAVDGRTNIRLGYGQVFDRPCLTALRLAALLHQRGWRGTSTPCGASCAVGGA